MKNPSKWLQPMIYRLGMHFDFINYLYRSLGTTQSCTCALTLPFSYGTTVILIFCTAVFPSLLGYNKRYNSTHQRIPQIMRKGKEGRKVNPVLMSMATTWDTPKYVPKGNFKGVQGLLCGKVFRYQISAYIGVFSFALKCDYM